MAVTRSQYKWLAEIPSKVKGISLAADETQLVDVAGDIRVVETALASIRTSVASEIPAASEGERWKMEQGRSAVRSYNTPTLIGKFAARWDTTLFATLVKLMELKVVKISWHYTNLMKLVAKEDITLTVAQHEIIDGDLEDIGEYWKDGYPSYKPVD